MSTIKANTLLHSDGSTTTQPSIPALDQRMAKAWAQFNTVGTVSITDSYNFSSITDQGVGRTDLNFTTAMSNTSYSALYQTRAIADNYGDASYVQDQLTSKIHVKHYENNVTRDTVLNSVIVFGN